MTICRNPYEVYFSMMKFMRIVIPRYCVQRPPAMEEIEKLMMDLYVRLYRKYIEERKYIPKGNLVEVKYEDFTQHPLSNLERIYAMLNLNGFRASEKSFRDYASTQAVFKTSKYGVSNTIKEKTYKEWKFSFDAFGYDK